MATSGQAKQQSFSECMMGILAELGKAEAYPDADPNVIQGVRDMILPAVQAQMGAQADPMAQMMQAMGGGAPGAPPGGPMEVQPAMGRLPRPGSDPREGAAAIERELAGVNQLNQS